MTKLGQAGERTQATGQVHSLQFLGFHPRKLALCSRSNSALFGQSLSWNGEFPILGPALPLGLPYEQCLLRT